MRYIIIFVFLSHNLFSQTGGQALYKFLDLPTSPKQIALGGVTLNSRDDVSQTLWNPSSVNVAMENDLSLNYVNYVSDIKVGSLSYARSINPKYGTAFLGFQYFNFGNLDRTNADGPDVLGTFSARDISFNIGYGYTYKTVSVGFAIKYVSSKIDTYTASALLYDLGITYLHPTEPLTIALVLRNSGGHLTNYMDTKELIQNNVILSATYKVAHTPFKIYGALDALNNWDISESNPSRATTDLNDVKTPEKITNIDNALRHISMGVELWSDKMIQLRVGYNHRKSQEFQLKEVQTRAGLSYGFGINTQFLRFDYAFAKFQEGAKYSTFGLTVHL